MFVIKNKLSLSYRWVKSMHYPETPKVTTHTFPLLVFHVHAGATGCLEQTNNQKSTFWQNYYPD